MEVEEVEVEVAEAAVVAVICEFQSCDNGEIRWRRVRRGHESRQSQELHFCRFPSKFMIPLNH